MLERIAFAALVLWVVLAPIPLGSVPEAQVAREGAFAAFLDAGGGYAIFRAVGFLAIGLAAAVSLSRRGDPVAPGRGYRNLLRLLFALVVLGLFQLLPLPHFVRAVLDPGGDRILYAKGTAPALLPLTVESGLTVAAVVRLALFGLAVIAVLSVARGMRRSWILLGSIAGIAAAVAAYGLVETIWLGDSVLGFTKTDPGAGVTGTFLYRGNFVALAAAGLGVAGAGLLAARRHRRPLPGALAAIAIPVLAAALVLSRSRAGLAAGALALGAAFFAGVRSLKLRLAGVGAVLVAVVLAIALSPAIRERFSYATGPASRGFVDIRIAAWDSTLDLALKRPVFGAGLGTYRRAIHTTQSDWIPEELWFAHSDPLNLLAEGGFVGLLLGVAVVVIGLTAAWRLARRGEGNEIGAACFAGLAGLGAMALVDFPLQIPATALVFVVLLAIPGAAGRESACGGRIRGLSGLALAATAVLVVLTGLGFSRDYDRRGEPTRTQRAAELLDGLRAGEALGLLDEELAEKPYEAAARYWRARALFAKGEFQPARRELIRARRVAHGRSDLLFRIGSMAWRLDDGRGLALDAFREACALDPHLHPKLLAALPREYWRDVTPARGDALDRLARAVERVAGPGAAIEALEGVECEGARERKEKAAALRRLRERVQKGV